MVEKPCNLVDHHIFLQDYKVYEVAYLSKEAEECYQHINKYSTC